VIVIYGTSEARIRAVSNLFEKIRYDHKFATVINPNGVWFQAAFNYNSSDSEDTTVCISIYPIENKWNVVGPGLGEELVSADDFSTALDLFRTSLEHVPKYIAEQQA
jgi:hypothetical protein